MEVGREGDAGVQAAVNCQLCAALVIPGGDVVLEKRGEEDAEDGEGAREGGEQVEVKEEEVLRRKRRRSSPRRRRTSCRSASVGGRARGCAETGRVLRRSRRIVESSRKKEKMELVVAEEGESNSYMKDVSSQKM